MEATADRSSTETGDQAPTKERVVSLNWMAVLRVMMGLVFLTTWLSNLNKGLYGDGFVPFIQSWADGTDFAWYATFLNNVVIPNADILHALAHRIHHACDLVPEGIPQHEGRHGMPRL